MTCKEKLIADHPEWDATKIKDTVIMGCPHMHMDIDEPTDCYTPGCYVKCWEREFVEIPVSEPAPTPPQTLEKSIQCEGCSHGEVCMHREDFIKIVEATQHSEGIVANVELPGGYEAVIDLMSEEYLKVDISCKHYRRKTEA